MNARNAAAALQPEELASVAKALADPSRIAILGILAQDDDVCVCDLVERTGLRQSLVSYHMKILREAGLVHEHQRGRWKHHRLDRPALRRFLDAWKGLVP